MMRFLSYVVGDVSLHGGKICSTVVKQVNTNKVIPYILVAHSGGKTTCPMLVKYMMCTTHMGQFNTKNVQTALLECLKIFLSYNRESIIER